MGWVIIDIVAPIVLLVVLIYAVVRWARRPRGQDAVSEAGARHLRERLNEEDIGGGSDGSR
jgi:hypothetical protein